MVGMQQYPPADLGTQRKPVARPPKLLAHAAFRGPTVCLSSGGVNQADLNRHPCKHNTLQESRSLRATGKCERQ